MAGSSCRSPGDLENGTPEGSRSSPQVLLKSQHLDPRFTDANPQRCSVRVSTGGILCPADAETNQCLLYAILNVLFPDRAAYTAVTAGNFQEPTHAIIHYLDGRGVHGNDGYDALCITWYFQHLMRANRIRGYEWRRLNGDEYRAMLSDSFTSGAFIVFGIAPATDEKQQAHRKIAKLERRLEGSGRMVQEGLRVAAEEGQKHRKSKLTHAVGLRVEGEDNGRTLYDTGNHVIKQQCTAKDLVLSVEKIHAVHRLQVYV